MIKLSGDTKNITKRHMNITTDIHIYILNRSIIFSLQAIPSKGTPRMAIVLSQ